MQRKNLLIFLVASVLFVGGLYLLDRHLFPPVPAPDKQEVEKLTPEQQPAALAVGALAAHLLPEKPRPKPAAPLPRDPIGLAAGGPIADLVGEPRREKPPVVNRPRPPRITLGS